MSRVLATEVAGMASNRGTDSNGPHDAASWAVIAPPHNVQQVEIRELVGVDPISGHFLDMTVAHDVLIGALGMTRFMTAWLTQLDQHENRGHGHGNVHGQLEPHDHNPGHDRNHGHDHGGDHGGGHI